MLAYFGQIELKSLEIRQYSCGFFVQFAAKSDGAILALDLISVSLKSIRLSGTKYYGDANYTMWVIHISEFGPYMNEQPLCSFHSAYEYLFSKRDYEAFGKKLTSMNPDLKVAENVDMRSEKVTKHHDDD